MNRLYFLGLAAGVRRPFRFLTVRGRNQDQKRLSDYLASRYKGEVVLTKNGRSALALALMAYARRGDGVIVNGFTCYAVYEAIKAAGMKPVFADITFENLNFNAETAMTALERAKRSGIKVTAVIIQNSLGFPVEIDEIEKIAKEHQLTIIEDLAHSVGVSYADGRESGTVGAGVAFSFGKDKSIDTTSGGALVLRNPKHAPIGIPTAAPRISDVARARFYPVFGAICRGLTHIHLGGALMRLLIKIHAVELSADNRLSLTERPAKFEARLALEQFERSHGAGPLRDFALVRDRDETLRLLKAAGYYFDAYWYERPVSPKRYYKEVKFPEVDCPVAVEVANHIINLPNYYSGSELTAAKKIIERHKWNRVK